MDNIYISAIPQGINNISIARHDFMVGLGRPMGRKWFLQCHVTADIPFPTWRPSNRKCTIFTCTRARSEIPNDCWGFSKTPDSNEEVPTTSRDCRCPFPNMADAKPEVYLSSLVGEVEAKFQMFFGGFQGRPIQRN